VFIRYLARTDETSLGRAAAAYCDALVATGVPVRLVGLSLTQVQVDGRGRCASLWDRHRALLTSPMDDEYINVVCGNVEDWNRCHTTGVVNALLIADENFEFWSANNPQPALIDVVEKYDMTFATSSAMANVVERVTARRPIVVPVGTEHAAGAFFRLRLP